MYRIIEKIRFEKKGFTLVEVLVALAILTVIMGGIAAITLQIFHTNELSTNRTLAIRQVQNAGQWLSRDIIQSTTTPILTSPNGFTLVITQDLTGLYGGDITVITYSIDGDGRLLRSAQVGTGTPSVTTVAVNVVWNTSDISNEAPSWVRKIGGNFELKITSTFGTGNTSATETRIYEIKPRPDNV